MTDLPVPGPPCDEEGDLLAARRSGSADLVEDRVEGDELLVEEHEGRLVPDHARHVVEQALRAAGTRRSRRGRGCRPRQAR